MADLVSINEAAKRGIAKLRLDRWANPEDHIKIDVGSDGTLGPWVRLYSPANEILGQRNPQELLIWLIGDLNEAVWRPYSPKESNDG